MRISRTATIAATIGLVAVLTLLVRHQQTELFGERATAPTDLVYDRAQILDSVQQRGIADSHTALRAEHDIDLRVMTTSAGGDINWRTHETFDTVGAGELSENGRGLLLLIDTEQDEVRLEVSTSLEGIYTDAFVSYIQHRQMVPFFRHERVADGVLATTELIVTRAQEARAGKAFAPPMDSESMGGGATAKARIGAGPAPKSSGLRRPEPVSGNRLSPSQVVDAYHEAMASRDDRPDLPIYSAGTVDMMQDWVMTPAQMDNVARAYRKCQRDGVYVEGELAVVRYRLEDRQCSPYFLRREDGVWKLDLTQMGSLVRFNHNNQWHFRQGADHPFQFAFRDWRFSGKGFPLSAD